MKLKTSSLIMIIFTLISVTAVSGCIDVNWATRFLGEEPPPPEYHEVQKWSAHHTFQLGPYDEVKPIHILENTIWMKINISVTLESSIGFRNVVIDLYKPGDKVDIDKPYFSKRYNTSASDHRTFNNPEVGQWTMKISGMGLSIGEIQDRYDVEVTAYEPDRRS